MRIAPNHPRLRVVSLACWALGSWCMVYGARLVILYPAIPPLAISVVLLAVLLLAVGISFWMLSNDRHAGIIFDPKGLLLNLGHSSAFITWENIEHVGVTGHRSSLLDLGSRRQIGIALRDGRAYAQSYEQRIPAGRGVLAPLVRLIERVLRPFRHGGDSGLLARMAFCRAKTGYDVLIPESLLGGKAEAFAELIEIYLLQPDERHLLDGIAWAG